MWRVHADAAMFPGGVAALLLQSLHPSAMAGVAGHSGYRGDPWGRLQRTSHFLATTTFGTVEDADAAIARVRGIHERVRGRDDGGRAVPGVGPRPPRLGARRGGVELPVGAYQRYAATPLTAEEADRYVEQSGVVARRLGALEVPDRRRRARRRPSRGTGRRCGRRAAARDAARFLLLDPPLPWAARPGYGLLASGGVALLPPWARRELRLPVAGAVAGAAGMLGLVGTGPCGGRWPGSRRSGRWRWTPGEAGGRGGAQAPAATS